jgi:type I restriction enzyme, S subunit
MNIEIVSIPEVLYFQEGPGVRNTQFTTSGVKLLNVGNINNGVIDLDATKIYISKEEAYGKYKHFLIEEGDLLIASSGIVVDNFHNKIAWAKAEHLPLCLNTSTIRFKSLDNNRLDIKYFSFYLKTQHFSDQLRKLITGSAQLNFGPSHLKQISFPLPPLPIQKRIAEILDAADALKRKDQQLIKKYNELAQSIFIDMFGDPVKNEKGWASILLGDVFGEGVKCGPFGSALKSDEYTSNGIPVWTMYNIVDFEFEEKGSLFINEVKFSQLDSYKVSNGDIIISRAGTVGKMCVVNSTAPISIISTNLIRLSLDKTKLSADYFVFLMKYFSQQVGRLKTGAEGAFTHMNTGVLTNLKITLPPIELQLKFVESCQTLKSSKRLLVNSTQNLFDSLIQKAFTGELVS